MPQPGAARISLKAGLPWGGMTTLSKTAPGKQALLENCYVNSDGSEIRMMPGYVCVIDPESTKREPGAEPINGFEITHIDARRPVSAAFSNYTQDAAPTESLAIWSRPVQLHGFEQVRDRWILFGDMGDRYELVHNFARVANTYVTVAGYQDDGVNITLTLDQQPSINPILFNTVQGGARIWLDGLEGPLATLLNGRGHIVNVATPFPTAVTVLINTTSTGVVAFTPSPGHFAKVTSNSSASGAAGASAVSDDEESLGIWTCLNKGSVVVPQQIEALRHKVYPAHVANRMRDFGDPIGNIIEGNSNAASGPSGRSRRRQKSLPYRLVPHVAGSRLIMAAPGYGCVFEAPNIIPANFDETTASRGISWISNDIFDRPRALGVPKVVVWEDPDPSATSYHAEFDVALGPAPPYANGYTFGGALAPGPARAGTYIFQFAYVDEATGEQGLLSERVVVKTSAAFNATGLRFRIYFPGYLLCESMAVHIAVYRSKKNGDTVYYDRTVQLQSAASTGFPLAVSSRYGLLPESATTEYFHHALYTALWSADDVLEKQLNPVPGPEHQMPMGCKAARTLRGWTFFGGALGNAGSRKELVQGTLTYEYDAIANGLNGIYPRHTEFGSMFTNDVAAPIPASFAGVEVGFGCGANNIPPAYAGQQVFARTIAPFPRKMMLLGKLVNTHVGWVAPGGLSGYGNPPASGRIQDVRYEVTDTPVASTIDWSGAALRSVTSYLVLPRSHYQISEPDNPNLTPATNTGLLANEIDDDIEGIGDAGGQAVICTRAKTYTVGFTQSPVGVPADIADERFGCIAANSMVSFEGGCAWISERGPVAMIGGAVNWIGDDLEQFFIGSTSRYLRDSEGLMRHAWACHDAERSLLYFGVFANRKSGTAQEVTVRYQGVTYDWDAAAAHADRDKIQSRFPCDEILVYSYRQDAWSVWRPNMAIQWMTRGTDDQGINRVFFMGQDRRIYVLDDTYSNGDIFAWQENITVTGSFSTFLHTQVHDVDWVGLTAVVLRETAGQPTVLVGVRTVTAADSGSSVTLSSPVDVQVGDKLLIGVRDATIRSSFVNIKADENADNCSVGMRFALWSPNDLGPPTVFNQTAFVKTTTVTNNVFDGVKSRKSVVMTSGDPQEYRWLGNNLQDDPVYDSSFTLGKASGFGHQVELHILGNAQVRLHDLYMEVQ